MTKEQQQQKQEDQEETEQSDQLQVITKPRPDLSLQRVYCVFCSSQMKFLTGMSTGHSQWLCETCGRQVYEGYGDTPARDAEYHTISALNDPYPFDDPDSIAGTPAMLKDISLDSDEIEDTEKRGVVTTSQAGNKRIRKPMRYAYSSPDEATKQI